MSARSKAADGDTLSLSGDQKKVNGVVWYLIGVLTCLRFFPSDIACVSVMM